MKFLNLRYVLAVGTVVTACVVGTGCGENPFSSPQPKSATGVTKAQAKIETQSNGLTVEQDNIKRRLEMENTPGGIKHLYIVSAYSGEVILYSTVDGKATSSGKRLSPYSVTHGQVSDYKYARGFSVTIGGETKMTNEVLQDDGTYGSSIPYLYWWDAQGVYHQHYVAGGQVIHISEQPMEFGRVTLQVEQVDE